jgi:hypothetical protein
MDVHVLIVLVGGAILALVAAARRDTPEPARVPVRTDDDQPPT